MKCHMCVTLRNLVMQEESPFLHNFINHNNYCNYKPCSPIFDVSLWAVVWLECRQALKVECSDQMSVSTCYECAEGFSSYLNAAIFSLNVTLYCQRLCSFIMKITWLLFEASLFIFIVWIRHIWVVMYCKGWIGESFNPVLLLISTLLVG